MLGPLAVRFNTVRIDSKLFVYILITIKQSITFMVRTLSNLLLDFLFLMVTFINFKS